MCSGALADCEQEINGSLRIFRYGLAMCNIDDINELLIRIDFDRCFFRRFFRFCLYVGQCETFRLLIKLIHQWICPLFLFSGFDFSIRLFPSAFSRFRGIFAHVFVWVYCFHRKVSGVSYIPHQRLNVSFFSSKQNHSVFIYYDGQNECRK